MRSVDVDALDRAVELAAPGTPQRLAALQSLLMGLRHDPSWAEVYDVLEVRHELMIEYEQQGRIEDALREADRLAAAGYDRQPDPRTLRAEILVRAGRSAEAEPIWAAVLADHPEDIWLYNVAGLEYGLAGEHETALRWLTAGLDLAVRTGDPEELADQLREQRAVSLAALDLPTDELQRARPRRREGRLLSRRGATASGPPAHAGPEPEPATSLAYTWIPPAEYADLDEHWPDIPAGGGLTEADGTRFTNERYNRWIESRLHAAAAAGQPALRVVPLVHAEYSEWLATRVGARIADPAALRAEFTAQGPQRGTPWPPPRNAPCWCTSGRKYKQCCGRPGVQLEFPL